MSRVKTFVSIFEIQRMAIRVDYMKKPDKSAERKTGRLLDWQDDVSPVGH
jgi:hypothetical protein